MQRLYVVGEQGYCAEPIAIFDNFIDAYTLASRVWPNTTPEVVSSRVHAVPYYGSLEINEEDED